MRVIDVYIDFLGVAWNARWSVIVANVWRHQPGRGLLPWLPPAGASDLVIALGALLRFGGGVLR